MTVGGPNDGEHEVELAFEHSLLDDGTLDTVIVSLCNVCGELFETRFSGVERDSDGVILSLEWERITADAEEVHGACERAGASSYRVVKGESL